MRSRIVLATGLKGLVALSMTCLLAGCATPPLDRARSEFYAGRFEQAESSLVPLPREDKDQVLFLMERGMARQALGKYEESAADWRAAGELAELLETYSISRGTASMLTSDRVLSFRGKPFERTLLYTFLAINYLAQHDWDYAAICARNIIQQLENREGFPDIAYSRYMAALCLSLIEDPGNAALQYRTASELLPDLNIDEHTGEIIPVPNISAAEPAPEKEPAPFELVCFVAIGAAASAGPAPDPASEHGPAAGEEEQPPSRIFESTPYAEFYHQGRYLGRSYTFNNTRQLRRQTEEQLALLQLAKEISRIAVKETISRTIEQQNELLGFLARITLFAFEAPDVRRWETLPLFLGIARLPCPEPLTSYKVVFRDAYGNAMLTREVAGPISRRGNVLISFCRDIMPRAASDEED